MELLNHHTITVFGANHTVCHNTHPVPEGIMHDFRAYGSTLSYFTVAAGEDFSEKEKKALDTSKGLLERMMLAQYFETGTVPSHHNFAEMKAKALEMMSVTANP